MGNCEHIQVPMFPSQNRYRLSTSVKVVLWLDKFHVILLFAIVKGMYLGN